MMSTVAKRKIISERQIKLKEYEKAGIVQLIKDRKLFNSIFIAEPYSRALIKEFYANLKKVINDIHSLVHELVFVRGDFFEFSLVMINSILGTKIVLIKRKNKLNLKFDMNTVTMELTGNFVLVLAWSECSL